MAPLSALPFGVAAGLFTLASVAVFATSIGWWLPRAMPGADRTSQRRRALLALGAGLYPPVAGSVFAGQANLLVFGLLAAGLAPFLPGRPVESGRGRALGSGVLLGLAGIVKLAPLALAVPLGLAARGRGVARAALGGLVLGAVSSLLVALVFAPAANRGASALADLFAPDPFWTNQSINGAVSRLFLEGDRTAPIVAGGPVPWIVALTAALAVATGVLLMRALGGARRADGGTLALSIALTIVAASIGAPKNSFWNHAPVLLAIALALAAVGPPRGRAVRALIGTWLVATIVEVFVDPLRGPFDGPFAALRTLASDAAVIGLLALWLALAIVIIGWRPMMGSRPAVPEMNEEDAR
jgi:hypothetical protein